MALILGETKMSKPALKSTKKPNPYARKILVQCKVNSDEMRQLLGKAGTYTNKNLSEWLRVAALSFVPKKEDFKK